jgi:hypothetical protein
MAKEYEKQAARREQKPFDAKKKAQAEEEEADPEKRNLNREHNVKTQSLGPNTRR